MAAAPSFPCPSRKSPLARTRLTQTVGPGRCWLGASVEQWGFRGVHWTEVPQQPEETAGDRWPDSHRSDSRPTILPAWNHRAPPQFFDEDLPSDHWIDMESGWGGRVPYRRTISAGAC